MMKDDGKREMSEAGKGSDMRKSTKQSRENFSKGYDGIKWTTKDDRQENFSGKEKCDEL